MTATGLIQGQSRDTEWKERGIRAALTINLSICAQHAYLRRQNYYHFDLHAGCGWNHRVNPPLGVIGSPLAYLEAVVDCEHPRAIGHFVDIDADNCVELAARPQVRCNPGCLVHNADNAEFCYEIPSLIKRHGTDLAWAFGSILIDPNGPTEVPWDGVAWVLKQCPRLDVIINWPGTGMKRMPDGHENKISILDVPVLLKKKHWLIRKNIGMWQWSLLIGRNIRCNDYPGMGFYHWDSPRGQKVVETLSRVGKSKQLKLF